MRVHASQSVCTPRSDVCIDQPRGVPSGDVVPHQLHETGVASDFCFFADPTGPDATPAVNLPTALTSLG